MYKVKLIWSTNQKEEREFKTLQEAEIWVAKIEGYCARFKVYLKNVSYSLIRNQEQLDKSNI